MTDVLSREQIEDIRACKGDVDAMQFAWKDLHQVINALCDMALSALDNAEDAERYRHLQNIAPKDAQAFFWNFNSRRQRSAAIDAARKESHD